MPSDFRAVYVDRHLIIKPLTFLWALLNFLQAPRTSRASLGKVSRSPSSSVSAQQTLSSHWHSIISSLSALLSTMRANHVNISLTTLPRFSEFFFWAWIFGISFRPNTSQIEFSKFLWLFRCLHSWFASSSHKYFHSSMYSYLTGCFFWTHFWWFGEAVWFWRIARSGRRSWLRDKLVFVSRSFLFTFYRGPVSFQCNASQCNCFLWSLPNVWNLWTAGILVLKL